MKQTTQVIFDKNSIEFVTVAAEYCAFIERVQTTSRKKFVDTALKILPLLYLKATLIPECEMIGEDALEVFLPDMIYSDTPIKKCISEDLADIYQDLKDFIGVFQLGMNASMNDSLCLCKEHFAEFWGQRLVNTMRALHDVKYNSREEDIDTSETWNNDEFNLS